jgi:hypothetical protein
MHRQRREWAPYRSFMRGVRLPTTSSILGRLPVVKPTRCRESYPALEAAKS